MVHRGTGPDRGTRPVGPGVEVSVSVPVETFRARREFGLVKHAPAWFRAPEGRIALSSAASPPVDREGKGVDEHRGLAAGESAEGGMQARATPERFSKGMEIFSAREGAGDWPTGVAPAPSRPQREVLTVTPRPMSGDWSPRQVTLLPLRVKRPLHHFNASGEN